ncbi:MAG: polyphosphate kinase 1, partial [Acidobacteria bacterium]|nr:polyphosphate kinase 1 [Acidobacteriota bacterium]
MTTSSPRTIDPQSPNAYINRELSWLGFARRVLSLVANRDLPLMERVKFAGIMGMLHAEFFMKRMSGLKRQIKQGSRKLSLDGRTPREEFDACRLELQDQSAVLTGILNQELLPALAEVGHPIRQYKELTPEQRQSMRTYCEQSVRPILTPLAVDSEHPFPFISNLGLNLAVLLSGGKGEREQFLRIKVPNNRPRWVPVPGGGYVPLEQVIAANLDLMYPANRSLKVYFFQVTRGAEGEVQPAAEEEESLREPGSLVQ